MAERKVWLAPATVVEGVPTSRDNDPRVSAIMTQKENGVVSFAGDLGLSLKRWREQEVTHIIAYDRKLKGNAVYTMPMSKP